MLAVRKGGAVGYSCKEESVTKSFLICCHYVAQEGSQFCRGFGGIGGLLRYSVDLTQFEAYEEEDGPEWNSDEDI